MGQVSGQAIAYVPYILSLCFHWYQSTCSIKHKMHLMCAFLLFIYFWLFINVSIPLRVINDWIQIQSLFYFSFTVPDSFTPTSKVSWKVEAFSLCMFLLLLTLQEVPHRTKGTGPRFITRPVYSRSQPQEQHEHRFCSSSTNAFILYSLYTVCRYCTSLGAPDLQMRLG